MPPETSPPPWSSEGWEAGLVRLECVGSGPAAEGIAAVERKALSKEEEAGSMPTPPHLDEEETEAEKVPPSDESVPPLPPHPPPPPPPSILPVVLSLTGCTPLSEAAPRLAELPPPGVPERSGEAAPPFAPRTTRLRLGQQKLTKGRNLLRI